MAFPPHAEQIGFVFSRCHDFGPLENLSEVSPTMLALGSDLREVSDYLLAMPPQHYTCRNHPDKADGDDDKTIGSQPIGVHGNGR